MSTSIGLVVTGSVNTVAEAFAFADDLGRDLVATAPRADGSMFSSTRSPMRMSATPVDVRRAPPTLGEHDDEIRTWLDAESGDGG